MNETQFLLGLAAMAAGYGIFKRSESGLGIGVGAVLGIAGVIIAMRAF